MRPDEAPDVEPALGQTSGGMRVCARVRVHVVRCVSGVMRLVYVNKSTKASILHALLFLLQRYIVRSFASTNDADPTVHDNALTGEPRSVCTCTEIT